MATDFPPALVDLQRRADAAWVAVEAHRKAVDERRRAETPDTPGRPAWVARPMRPWTEAEDAKFARLMAAARDAQQALRDGIKAAGLEPTIQVVQGLKAAAKAE